MPINTNCLTDKQTFWLAHLERCAQRDISLAHYAREEGLNIQSLYSWKQFFAKKQKNSDAVLSRPSTSISPFIKARVVSPTAFSRILFPNGVSIEIDADVDTLLLEQLASLRTLT